MSPIFCKTCPDRGTCAESIARVRVLSSDTEGLAFSSYGVVEVENGDPQGPTTMTVTYEDSSGGKSKPITVHGDSRSRARNNAYVYINGIERCDGPVERKKFFGLVTKRVCAASNLESLGL